MSYETATLLANELCANAAPVLTVVGIDAEQPRWCRNVADGDERRGPWRAPSYEVIDHTTWDERAPCLYWVRGSDGGLRYVGISKNRLKDRWRMSPAYDETCSSPLGVKHLFHSRCWPEMESEFERKPGMRFEVRVSFVPALRPLLARMTAQQPEVPSIADLSDEAVPGAIEKWLRRHRRVSFGVSFLTWNKN